ncbi:extracellular solute-binding protein [Acetobacter orientalis]|uniref:extracellular solute-binding protein n=1 Tax=Acetobacter orientalis TaxID=146474 RepID=UPI0039ED1B76
MLLHHAFAPHTAALKQTRRTLGAFALACTLLSGLAGGAHARTYHRVRHAALPASLKVLTFGGAIAATQQKVLFTPYEQAQKHTISGTPWDGTLDSLKKQESLNPKRWAALMMENSSLQVSCSLGLLVRDPTDTSNASCGQPSATIDYAMAWDHSRFETPPNWADFWDVARHPGRRGLRKDPRTTLEIALLADGVPSEALYRVLNTRDGIDRAFRKLDQLRPYIVWWSTPEEAARILKSGGALMGSVPTGEILSLPPTEREHFGIFWSQRLAVNYAWGIPKTAGQDASALALVAWLEHPTQKQAFANAWPSLPSLTEMASGPADLQHLPSAIPVDDTFWDTHLAELSTRFEHWATER